MTSSRSSDKSDKPKSMIEADTANGEAADTHQHDETRRSELDEHLTGTRQAQENLENDLPA